MEKALTVKQEKFVDEYIKTGNGTKAAIAAGYSAESARITSAKLLTNTNILREVKKRMDEVRSNRTADLKECLEYLTSVLRGETKDVIVVNAGTGKGFTKAESIEVPTTTRDRLKAAEYIMKVHGAFREQNSKGNVPTEIRIIRASKEKNYNS